MALDGSVGGKSWSLGETGRQGAWLGRALYDVEVRVGETGLEILRWEF